MKTKLGQELLAVYVSELVASDMSTEDKYDFLAELFSVVAADSISKSHILMQNKVGSAFLAQTLFTKKVTKSLGDRMAKLK